MASTQTPALARRLLLLTDSTVHSTQLPPLRRALKIPSPFRRTFLPAITVPLATLFSAQLLGTITSIWESILLAVPKKKTSYSKKRSRQLAGKALKDVTSLNYCSSCGRVKRAHVLCSHCVMLVRDMWTNNTVSGKKSDPDKKTDPVKTLEPVPGSPKTSLYTVSQSMDKPKNSWTDKLRSLWKR